MAQQINRVGVVGLGAMGKGIAQSLLRAGFELHVCDVRAEAVHDLVALGAHAAESPAAMALQVDALLIVVVNAAQTDAVLFGAQGAAAHLKQGSVVIACATVAPEFAEGLGARLQSMGLQFIDAPISGGAAKAAAGIVPVLAGAPFWAGVRSSELALPAHRPPSCLLAGRRMAMCGLAPVPSWQDSLAAYLDEVEAP